MTSYHPRISSEKSSLFRTVIKLSVLILVKEVTINIVNVLKELKKINCVHATPETDY